tara:strand:+ start:595 stop:870 length:276 start_codon:yes stop_codon:yes gene_type:complete
MLKPLNRYLVVQPVEEEKKESGVLVPEEYTTQINHNDHMVVSVVSVNECDPLPFTRGIKLLVPAHTVEKISVFGENYYVVLENHVIGFFDN